MKRAKKLISTFAMLGALTASGSALAHYQPKDGDSQKFKININDQQVGIYHVDFSVPQEGAILATTTSLFKLNIMGKQLADVRSKANELIWQGDFIEMQGMAVNGEDKYEMKMKREDDGKVAIKSLNFDDTAPAGTVPFSFWNADTLKAKHIFDPINQKVVEIEPKKIRTETLRVLGEDLKCVKYKLKDGQGRRMYLWYAENEQLCRMAIKSDKFELTYVPYE